MESEVTKHETINSRRSSKEILAYQQITFLTGAGVSTPSGVPDYRSLSGIYHGMEQPEYLLSHQAMVNEPDKFYQFVKKIYHPEAKPNIIHLEMAHLAKEKMFGLFPKTSTVCTQRLKARNSSIFMEVCINVIVENVNKR